MVSCRIQESVRETERERERERERKNGLLGLMSSAAIQSDDVSLHHGIFVYLTTRTVVKLDPTKVMYVGKWTDHFRYRT